MSISFARRIEVIAILILCIVFLYAEDDSRILNRLERSMTGTTQHQDLRKRNVALRTLYRYLRERVIGLYKRKLNLDELTVGVVLYVEDLAFNSRSTHYWVFELLDKHKCSKVFAAVSDDGKKVLSYVGFPKNISNVKVLSIKTARKVVEKITKRKVECIKPVYYKNQKFVTLAIGFLYLVKLQSKISLKIHISGYRKKKFVRQSRMFLLVNPFYNKKLSKTEYDLKTFDLWRSRILYFKKAINSNHTKSRFRGGIQRKRYRIRPMIE